MVRCGRQLRFADSPLLSCATAWLPSPAEWEREQGPLTEAELQRPARGFERRSRSDHRRDAVRYDRCLRRDLDRRRSVEPRAVRRSSSAVGARAPPVTTAPVIAQVSRSAKQAQLRRFLRGCDVVPFAEVDAHEVGALAGTAGTSDVVDVHVVLVAHRRGFGVVTSDQDDLGPIVSAAGRRVPPIRV